MNTVAVSMQDMTRVSHHFVRGKNPKKFASILVNFLGKVSVLEFNDKNANILLFFFLARACVCVEICSTYILPFCIITFM